MKRILYIIIMTAAVIFSNIASAQQSEQERDPFFPEGPRSAATMSASQDNNWGRDPFIRPFEGNTQLQQPASADRIRGKNLTGIIYGRHVRLAIIGSETFREGSMLGDRKLVDIRRRSVVFMNGSGSYEELFLEDFSIRK